MTDSCRQSSLDVSEELLGSAPANTNYWLLVESRAPFSPKVVKQSALADLLRPLTDGLSSTIPTARVQFIRRPEMRDTQHPLQAFVADAREPRAKLWTRHFHAHEELLDIVWDESTSAQPPKGFEATDGPVILVCTHGKRDACCALHGRAFLKGLADGNRAYVWESSHIGGHRFAATCVTLPSGHYYGRLNVSDANPLVEASQRGELYDLRTFRGWAKLPVHAQVAEGRLREKHGLLGLSDVRYLGLSEDHAHVFSVSGSEHLHRGHVTTSPAEGIRVKSCGKAPEPFLHHVVSWTS